MTREDFMQRVQEGDKWEYKGLTLLVIHNDFGIPKDTPYTFSRLLLEGNWHGYVLTDIYIPDEQIHDIDVHGGITLADYGTPNLYGFDTAHADDFDNLKSKEWVMKETQRFADNILQWKATNP